MVLASDAFRLLNKTAGRVLRIRYYTETIGSVWDDDRTTAGSGNDLYVSGMVLNIDSTAGTDDQVLVEEGRIKFNDTKFYVAGSLDTTSGVKIFTVAISGVDAVYRQVTPGLNRPQFLGDSVYKKIYGRLIPGGSLF